MRLNNVFKPVRSKDQLECAYLYSDGTVVCSFTRRLRDLGSDASYYKISEGLVVRAIYQGRIVFHNPALLIAISLLPNAGVTATEASIKHGSDNSKSLGILVSNLTVHSEFGQFSINMMPMIISSNITYQPNRHDVQDWPNVRTWGDHPVIRDNKRSA